MHFKGSEVNGGAVLGVGLSEVAFFGVSLQRLVSLLLFFFPGGACICRHDFCKLI